MTYISVWMCHIVIKFVNSCISCLIFSHKIFVCWWSKWNWRICVPISSSLENKMKRDIFYVIYEEQNWTRHTYLSIMTWGLILKIRCQQKYQKYFFINVWRKSVFDIYFTEFSAALTTVLLVLFKCCYKYCYSDSRKLWAVMKGGVWRFKIWFNPPFL